MRTPAADIDRIERSICRHLLVNGVPSDQVPAVVGLWYSRHRIFPGERHLEPVIAELRPQVEPYLYEFRLRQRKKPRAEVDRIINILKAAFPSPVTSTRLADKLGCKECAVRKQLSRLTLAGNIVRTARGLYTVSSSASLNRVVALLPKCHKLPDDAEVILLQRVILAIADELFRHSRLARELHSDPRRAPEMQRAAWDMVDLGFDLQEDPGLYASTLDEAICIVSDFGIDLRARAADLLLADAVREQYAGFFDEQPHVDAALSHRHALTRFFEQFPICADSIRRSNPFPPTATEQASQENAA
jgi:biotin operon repressor